MNIRTTSMFPHILLKENVEAEEILRKILKLIVEFIRSTMVRCKKQYNLKNNKHQT